MIDLRSDTVNELIPPPLRKRLQPPVAGEAIARGIEKRAPRVVQPRRWAALSFLRGIVNPITDAQLVRDARVQAMIRRVEEREGTEQRTTA